MFMNDIKKAGYEYTITTIIYSISVLLLNLNLIWTIYHYIPAYHFIPAQLRLFILWITQLFVPFIGEYKTFSVITLGVYILEVFGISVLLELIIIRVCGMDKNVEIEIINRQKEDLLDSFEYKKSSFIPLTDEK